MRTTATKKQTGPIDILVGNRVRIRRMLIGMSQERLGELLNVAFQQVQKYEKGVNRIGAGRLFEISQILGAPITYFYEGASKEMLTDAVAEECLPPIMEFFASGEGLQLGLAFVQIKDAKVRRRVLNLVRTLVDEEAVN